MLLRSPAERSCLRRGSCEMALFSGCEKNSGEVNVIESEGMFSFRGSFKGDKVGIFWRNEAGRPREFPAKSEL